MRKRMARRLDVLFVRGRCTQAACPTNGKRIPRYSSDESAFVESASSTNMGTDRVLPFDTIDRGKHNASAGHRGVPLDSMPPLVLRQHRIITYNSWTQVYSSCDETKTAGRQIVVKPLNMGHRNQCIGGTNWVVEPNFLRWCATSLGIFG